MKVTKKASTHRAARFARASGAKRRISRYFCRDPYKKIITSLRPLREFTGRVGGQDITFTPEIPAVVEAMLKALEES